MKPEQNITSYLNSQTSPSKDIMNILFDVSTYRDVQTMYEDIKCEATRCTEHMVTPGNGTLENSDSELRRNPG